MNTYWKVDANISGANPSLGTAAVTSYTGITNGSLTLTNNSGTGNIAAQIGCSSTNSPSGTTCSSGDESVSVAFTPLGTFPQDVRVCASFSWSGTTGSSAGNFVAPTFQLVETATNAQTVIQEGKARENTNLIAPTAAALTGNIPFTVCGTFTFAAPGQRMIRLMYEQNISGTPGASLVLADASANDGQRDVNFVAFPLSYNTPAPILVGGVTSGNTTGGERVERVAASGASPPTNCGSDPCTIESSTISTVAVARSTTGTYTVTWPSGTFSSKPSCNCSANSVGVAGLRTDCVSISTSATAVSVNTYREDTGVLADTYFQMTCQGPR
jgi:hypothetical protein